MEFADIPVVGPIISSLNNVSDALSDTDSAAEQLRKKTKTGVQAIDNIIQPKVESTNWGWLDGILSSARSIWAKFKNLVLGWFGGEHQKPAKDDCLKQLEANKPVFDTFIKSILPSGKDAEAVALSEELQKECESTIKDAFGWTGMSDANDVIKQSLKLNEVIKVKVYESLLKEHGTKITDAQALKIAKSTASGITGISEEILDQDRPELRLQANPPTTGIAGMLLKVQKELSIKNGPKVNVPALTFNQATLSQAIAEAKTIGAMPAPAPAPAPLDPKLKAALENVLGDLTAKGWDNIIGRADANGKKDGKVQLEELIAALPKGFSFASLDINSDGKLSGREVTDALLTVRQGKAAATGI